MADKTNEESLAIYQAIISDSPNIAQFFETNPLKRDDCSPRRVESYWRGGNDIYVIEAAKGKYVLKRINQPTGATEIEYHRKLSAMYPMLVPHIFAQDGRSYVMEYVGKHDLKSLLTRSFKEAHLAIEKAAGSLFKIYSGADQGNKKASAVHQIKYTEKYRKFGPDELRDQFEASFSRWDAPLREYDAATIHNDLNSLNFRFREDDTICAIDSRADVEGIHDFAKDIGRALAGLISAAMDNHHSPNECVMLSRALTDHWEGAGLEQRTAFYVAQSWFSFSRWDTPRFKKEGFWFQGIDLLEGGPRFDSLSDLVGKSVDGFVKFGRER